MMSQGCCKVTRPLSPCPLSHEGRGGIPHQKAVRLPSPRVGEGLGVGEAGGNLTTLQQPYMMSGPTLGLTCAAGGFYRSVQLVARDERYKTRQVEGRASGVRCRPCWAAS